MASYNKVHSNRAYTPEQEVDSKNIILTSKKGHYAVLGVKLSATDIEIKKAYRTLALKFHPDKNGAPSAEAAFKVINAAKEFLNNLQKRTTNNSDNETSKDTTNNATKNTNKNTTKKNRKQYTYDADKFEDLFKDCKSTYQMQEIFKKIVINIIENKNNK
jgi:curved DNA-binding protein CbpA